VPGSGEPVPRDFQVVAEGQESGHVSRLLPFRHDEAVDDLHVALLDLFLPGHEETAADRARARTARQLIEQDKLVGSGGGA